VGSGKGDFQVSGAASRGWRGAIVHGGFHSQGAIMLVLISAASCS